MSPVRDSRAFLRHNALLLMICLAQFMVILDVSVVNVALPAIRDDLGFSATGLQWVVNAYALTFAGFLLLGGRAADLLGQRRVFIFGLALFGLASLAGGLSQGQGQLVVARAVQGLGGAVVAPVTLSILTTTFAEGTERNKALAVWGAMGAAGEMIAAPSPWMARAPMSTFSDHARPHRKEAIVKTATPTRKTRRRPSRSAARPPSSRNPPKVIA